MMFVVTENMFNNVPFFNFMEKHNSVNRSVSIGLKPDDGVCLIRKYQVFEICIYIFSFFSWNQKKIFKEFFHVCTFKLKLRDTYFDCESKIIIWIMCVYVLVLIWWTEKTCTRIFFFKLSASKQNVIEINFLH